MLHVTRRGICSTTMAATASVVHAGDLRWVAWKNPETNDNMEYSLEESLLADLSNISEQESQRVSTQARAAVVSGLL